MRSARSLKKKSLSLEETRYHSDSSGKSAATASVKISNNDNNKLKESGMRDKYQNPSRELKKLWNKKLVFIPIIIISLGTVKKGLLKGLVDLEIRG